VPLSTIQAVNDAVEKVINSDSHGHSSGSGKQGNYSFILAAVVIMPSSITVTAIKHFSTKHPALKWSTVNDWKRR